MQTEPDKRYAAIFNTAKEVHVSYSSFFVLCSILCCDFSLCHLMSFPVCVLFNCCAR